MPSFVSRAPRRSPSLARALVVLAASLAALGAWPDPARTQATTWDAALATTITGTWTLAVSEEAAQSAVEAGIRTAVAGLPPLVDSVAASTLRERTPISRNITFSVTETRIEARFAHGTYISAPGMPTPMPVPNAPGETMEMVQLLRDGSLEQITTTDGGRRWSTFTPTADGTRLSLSAVIHSDRLSADMRFRIPYRRAE